MTSRDRLVSGFLLFALASVFFYAGDDEPSARDDLVEVSGSLSFVEEVVARSSLSAVRFALSSDRRYFHYDSKGGRIRDVIGALRTARSGTVRVLFDPSSPFQPTGDDRIFYSVYELTVGGKDIRAYDQVVDARRSDNEFGKWAGYATALGGAFLFLWGILQRRGA